MTKQGLLVQHTVDHLPTNISQLPEHIILGNTSSLHLDPATFTDTESENITNARNDSKEGRRSLLTTKL